MRNLGKYNFLKVHFLYNNFQPSFCYSFSSQIIFAKEWIESGSVVCYNHQIQIDDIMLAVKNLLSSLCMCVLLLKARKANNVEATSMLHLI